MALFLWLTLGRAPYTSSRFTDFESATSNPIAMASHDPGTIVVEVAGDDGVFDFAILEAPLECPDFDLTLTGDASETCLQVPAGTYTLVETVPATGNWQVGLDCVEDGDANTDDSSPPAATIVLDEGETVTCTFTNTLLGSITIVQGTDTGSAVQYLLSSNLADCEPVSLADGEDKTCDNLPSGTYDVQQDVPSGWDIGSVDCGSPASSITPIADGVSIDLVAGENVTCTFTNEPE